MRRYRATLAVTSEAYRRVGGLPCVPLGEDKALIAQLVSHDAKIRFCSAIEVTTSGRINGRAPGGVADTLRLRSGDPDAFCDEPVRVAMRRARWRGRLRHSGELAGAPGWAVALGIAPDAGRCMSSAETFGKSWSAVEAASPVLTKRLLTPAPPDRRAAFAAASFEA